MDFEFSDDNAILSSHVVPCTSSSQLNVYLIDVETCLKNWRILVNELKSKQVTFTLHRGDRQAVTPILNNVDISQSDHIVYFGIHIERRLIDLATSYRSQEASTENKSFNHHLLFNQNLALIAK